MKSFKEYHIITERFKNFFVNDKEEREQYVDQVWDVLQASYKRIGGIKGSGFNSKQDMIDNIPFWKINVKNGKVIAVGMYKDKKGRKSVAVGTDGSEQGKEALAFMVKGAFKTGREWREISGSMLVFVEKVVGIDAMLKSAIQLDKVKKLLPKDDIISGYGDDVKKPHEKSLMNKLDGFVYQREIGGHLHTKVAFGVDGLPIVTNARD